MERGKVHEEDPPRIYARPIIPVLLAFICGITAGLYVPGFPRVFLTITSLIAASMVLAWKGRKLRLLPLLIFFLLGYWKLQGWTAPKLPANHVSRSIDNAPWHIVGVVDSRPKNLDARTRFVLKAESLTRKQISHAVTGAVQVTVKDTVQDLGPGDRVAFLAKLKPIRNFNNPGSFDYVRYMAFKGIWASAYVSKKSLLVKLHSEKTGMFYEGVHQAQQAVSYLIERASPEDARARGILKALMLGDRSGVSPEDREAFNRAGVAHLLAISGLHIGMVASPLHFLFSAMCWRDPIESFWLPGLRGAPP